MTNKPFNLSPHRVRLQARAGLLFSELTQNLHSESRVLRYELEGLCLPSGQLDMLWSNTPFRPIEQIIAVLDDLDVLNGIERNKLEDALTDIVFLTTCSVLLHDGLMGAETGFQYIHTLIAPSIHTLTAARMHAVSGAWAFDALANAWKKAVADFSHHYQFCNSASLAEPLADSPTGGRWSPVSLAALAAIVAIQGEKQAQQVAPLFDEAQRLFALGQELANLNRDLARGAQSQLIANLVHDCGIPPNAPIDPNRIVLGAMVLPTLPQWTNQAIQDVATLTQRTNEVGFSALGRTFEWLAEPFTEFKNLLSGHTPEKTAPSIVISPTPQRTQALRAAKAYLDSDGALRESWEEYRWGFLGSEHLTGRIFTPGLVLERKLLTGDRQIIDKVHELIARYEANGFHYFEEPSPLPPDTDTLGLILRLSALSKFQVNERFASLLKQVQKNSESNFPVFIFDEPECHTHVRTLTGQHCAAVQAGFITGLAQIGGGLDELRHLTRGLLQCIQSQATAAFVHYDVPFGILMLRSCSKALCERGIELSIVNNIEAAIKKLSQPIYGRVRHSPQDAAMLLLANALHQDLIIEAENCIMRNQRPDGSWNAEPLFMAPNRGARMTPFSSKTVTSAFCWHALFTLHS